MNPRSEPNRARRSRTRSTGNILRRDGEPSRARPSSRGFTLVEVMVAVAILAIVLLSFLSTRSNAMADAISARNWRLARSIAEEQLSKLQAGANELRPEPLPVDVQGYPGFRYSVLIGEQAIANAEAEIDSVGSRNDNANASERRMWQRERDDLRNARQKGLSVDDYRRQQLEQEVDPDAVPSEDEFEEVAVIVYFPNISLSEDVDSPEETFILKSKVSTLAIHGMTPQQAESLAAQKGVTVNGNSGASAASRGNNEGK